MAITHDWGIRGVDSDTSNNRVLRIHWTLDSYDGDTQANSYGTMDVSTVTVIPAASMNKQASINLLYQELGLKKKALEQTHGDSIVKQQGGTVATDSTITGTAANASVTDITDYTNVVSVIETLPVPNKTFIVKVATKTAAHPEFGKGSEKGYTIDGVEGATLTLLPGQTYRFSQADASNSEHPLRLFKKRTKIGAYLKDVTSFGTPGQHGAFTQVTIPLVDPHTPLYYQCSVHHFMGGILNVTITSSEVGSSNTGSAASSSSSSSSNNQQQSSSGQQQSSSGQQQSSSGQQQSSGGYGY